ncbi:aldehyde dehydrogenase family protein [Streptomyces sp. NPDC044780]|uniref:aldehyde dehydrogenase family protein n=1 Tax=unclassified Streptomyces TaxID=2593676 RepID=UPI0033C8F09D
MARPGRRPQAGHGLNALANGTDTPCSERYGPATSDAATATYDAGGGVELPFDGFGASGYGREKGYEALDFFTETKTTVVSLA